jgi:hypothetical protein
LAVECRRRFTFRYAAHRPDQAQAWLRFRDVSVSDAVMMRSLRTRIAWRPHLPLDLYADTCRWTAIVLPANERGRLVDLLAIARHNDRICNRCWPICWQVCRSSVCQRDATQLAHGQLRRNLAARRGIFPLLQFASDIGAQDSDHAWEIAHQAFISNRLTN